MFSRSASLFAREISFAPTLRHASTTRSRSSSTPRSVPSTSTINAAPVPGATNPPPRFSSIAARESLSISSTAAGTTRRRINSETASTAPRIPSKVARSVWLAGGFGTSRSVIFVMIASVPSEPTRSCVRS